MRNQLKISELYFPSRPGKTARAIILKQIMVNFLVVEKITKKEMLEIIYNSFLMLLL